MKTVKFYANREYIGCKEMSLDIVPEVVNWIELGNDIKIGYALINNPVCAANLIQINS